MHRQLIRFSTPDCINARKPPACHTMRHILTLLASCLGLVTALAQSDIPQPGQSFTLSSPGITMIWVAPGSFRMSDPLGAGDDTQVTLTHGYWLGRTEVTQAQWQAVISQVPVLQNTPLPSYYKGSNRPVEQVPWTAVMEFCAALTEFERTAGRLPAGYAYTLPTEAQWEYAARPGAATCRVGLLDAFSWYKLNSSSTTHPVAQKQPNALGFCDMQGNVNEWCRDWYAPYPGGTVVDPVGPAIGVYRVVRGASSFSTAGSCRVDMRWYGAPYIKGYATGFRLALAPLRANATEATPSAH